MKWFCDEAAPLLIKYATPGSHLQQHRKTQGKKGGASIFVVYIIFFCSMNSSNIGNDEKNKTLKALLHFMQKSKGGPRRYRKKWATEMVRKLG
jgi:hypothetical protein